MLVTTLVDVAKMRSGKSFGQLADELDMPQSKLSEWKKGKVKPTASEIAYLAMEAGLDVLDTISAIEEEKKPTCAKIWRRVGVTGGNGGIRTLDEALHPILP
jgi:ribosome-binding protein aMBF1 (putative translation factor)